MDSDPQFQKHINFGALAVSSGLRATLVAASERMNRLKGFRTGLTGSDAQRVVCELRDVTCDLGPDGQVSIWQIEVGVRVARFKGLKRSFLIGLRDSVVGPPMVGRPVVGRPVVGSGQDPLSSKQKLLLARVALSRIAQHGMAGERSASKSVFGNTPVGVDLECLSRPMDFETYTSLLELPGRVRVCGPLIDEQGAESEFIDVWVANSARGEVMISGVKMKDCALESVQTAADVNMFHLIAKNTLGEEMASKTFRATRRTIDLLFDKIAQQLETRGLSAAADFIEQSLWGELRSPHLLAGRPMALPPLPAKNVSYDLGVLPEPVLEESIDEVAANWLNPQQESYLGLYPDGHPDDQRFFRFLDALRFVENGHSLMFVGMRDTGAAAEEPADRAADVKRYLIFLDDEMIPRQLSIDKLEAPANESVLIDRHPAIMQLFNRAARSLSRHGHIVARELLLKFPA